MVPFCGANVVMGRCDNRHHISLSANAGLPGEDLLGIALKEAKIAANNTCVRSNSLTDSMGEEIHRLLFNKPVNALRRGHMIAKDLMKRLRCFSDGGLVHADKDIGALAAHT